MKINTKETIKDLAGKDIKSGDETLTVGVSLANILLGAKEGGKMKMFVLAQKLYSEKTVEVDAADLGLINKAVESTESSSIYTNLVTGQLLVILSRESK